MKILQMCINVLENKYLSIYMNDNSAHYSNFWNMVLPYLNALNAQQLRCEV